MAWKVVRPAEQQVAGACPPRLLLGRRVRVPPWDALGRLVAVKIGPDTVARFRYDPFGRRVLKVTGTTTRDSLWFVYNAGVQVLVDVTGNGAADTVRAEYGYGPGSDQVWTVWRPGTGLDGVLLLGPLIGSVRVTLPPQSRHGSISAPRPGRVSPF